VEGGALGGGNALGTSSRESADGEDIATRTRGELCGEDAARRRVESVSTTFIEARRGSVSIAARSLQ
jgi:hypothetical protein